MLEPVPTSFPRPLRATKETIDRQSRLILDSDLLAKFYDAVSETVVILNSQRQIVFCNQNLADMLGVKDRRELYGKRPGEAIGCIHAQEGPDGCGTAEACAFCGAVESIFSCQKGRADVKEAQILRGRPAEAMDMSVRTSSLVLGGEQFVIAAFTDISHEKRRRALERIFFHDLLNTVASMRLLADIIAAKPEKMREMAARVGHGVSRLMEEIASQRDLMAAENNDLPVRPLAIETLQVLSQIVESYRDLAAPKNCTVVLDGRAKNVSFTSDVTIFSRVLGNMVKNAVEASAAGDVVTVGCEQSDSTVKFQVHNPAEMPKDVQLQLFKRSFSTKGGGRGLGTYSMRLLTEKYLQGQVSFVSTAKDGTTFTVTCPMRI